MLEKICKSINATDNEHTMLLGDYNFRNINWEDSSTKRNIDQEFVDTIQDNFFTQIMDSPTKGDNILDLAYTCDPASIPTVKPYPPPPPPHTHTHTQPPPPPPPSDPATTRSYSYRWIAWFPTSEPTKIYLHSQGDYDGLNTSLGTVDWDSLLNSNDIEINWNIYKKKYEELIEVLIPHKSSESRTTNETILDKKLIC